VVLQLGVPELVGGPDDAERIAPAAGVSRQVCKPRVTQDRPL